MKKKKPQSAQRSLRDVFSAFFAFSAVFSGYIPGGVKRPSAASQPPSA